MRLVTTPRGTVARFEEATGAALIFASMMLLVMFGPSSNGSWQSVVQTAALFLLFLTSIYFWGDARLQGHGSKEESKVLVEVR